VFLMSAFCLFSPLALPSLYAWNTLPSRAQDQPGFVFTPSPADWREINLYQVMTDRFFDGDSSNNNARGGYDAGNGHWAHGGDFKGVQEKLGYLEDLGVKAIWISPVQWTIDRTHDNLGNQYIPYHGYMPTDLNRINSQFGTLQDLRNLIDAAHAKGIYVILDIVVNHLADLMGSATPSKNEYYNVIEYNDPVWHKGYAHGEPFNDIYRFHRNGKIENYEDVNQYLRGELTGGLDDIRTEDTNIRQDLATIYKALISATDCDGFRIDAVKHVEMDFWDFFLPQIYNHAASLGKSNFLCFGEVFNGSDDFVGDYTGATRHNSMLYFPMFETMEDVFVEGQRTSLLTERTGFLHNYAANARYQMVNFLDNHDDGRILASGKLSDDWWRLKVALAWLYTSHQIPCLYYGTEQGFDGGSDPWNREDMFDGGFEFGPSNGDNFNPGHELFLFIRKLNELRAQYPALTKGSFTQRWEDSSGRGIYAYTKQLADEEVIVVLNTHYDPKTCYPGALEPAGTRYVNLLNPAEKITVDGGGTLPITLSGHHVMILVPDITPSTAEFSPPHPTGCGDVTITYHPGEGLLQGSSPVHIFIGHDGWQEIVTPHPAMTPGISNEWTYVYTPPPGVEEINCVFHNADESAWDNNQNQDWKIAVSGCLPPPITLVEGSPHIESGGTPNLAGQAFDFNPAGSYARTTKQGGFGSFGKIFVNYDATNFYIGGIELDVDGSNNAAVIFLSVDSFPAWAAVENLWNVSGKPRGLDFMHNFSFGPTSMCVAIVLGDEWGDGTFPDFDLEDGYNFGQGVFYLSQGLHGNFEPVAGARLSQFDGDGQNLTTNQNDDADRRTDRWEACIPWSSLYASNGVSSVTQLYLGGLIASSSTNGNNRYLSGNYLGAAADAPEGMDGSNFGYKFASLTGIEVLLPDHPDSDHDGLPDAWERLFFEDLDMLWSGGDRDLDGSTDDMEMRAGTHPDDDTSAFEARAIRSGSSVVLSWHSVSNRVYSVWRANSLQLQDFSNVAPGLSATAPLNTWTDHVESTEGFYQVRTE